MSLETSNIEEAQLPPVLMPSAIWQILAQRGYHSKDAIEELVNPKLKDLAHPYSIHDMQVAVDRLLRAYQQQEKILIYGDYDLDGSPGVALLHDGLTRLGFKDLAIYQPSRLNEGYGLHAHLIEKFKGDGVSLLVTVDVGITDTAAVDEANRLEIDVIITDHHLPKEKTPKAVAILNPNKGFCTSQLQHLCGTGVAFYLVLALKLEMTSKKMIADNLNLKELLDLFALATVTDMVPLVRENRVLVKHGLLQLARTERPGLRHLFSELGLYGKQLNAQDIAFRVAPKLNALTRLDEGLRAVDVIMADAATALSRVQETLLINERRRSYQNKASEISKSILKFTPGDPCIWLYAKDFHPGVISLLASDLMQEYNVPVYVGAEHNEGQIIGSARAPNDNYNLQLSLGHASEILNRFGGHKLAAGFEVDAARAEEFRARLNDFYLSQTLPDEGLHQESTQLNHDAILRLDEVDYTLMGWLEKLGPFGMGFETPHFLIRAGQIKSVKKLKGDYLKYKFEDANGRSIDALWFNNPQLFKEGQRVDVVLELQWNDFNGRRSIQGLIQAAKLTI